MKVVKILVDGGPCGGKTTLMTRLSKKLEKHGCVVLIVPEVPTILISNGFTPWGVGDLEFQRAVVQMQCFNEEFFKHKVSILAEQSSKTPVLIFDRGLLTGAAYFPEPITMEFFQEMVLDDFGLKASEIINKYDCVVYLQTAAHGAREHYNLDNKARKESIRKARMRCDRTREIWSIHANFKFFPNIDESGKKVVFKKKMNDAINHALEIVKKF